MDSERTTAKPTLLWMACGGCSGESMAILGAEGRGRRGDTLPGFLDEHDVELLWHPSLSLESPRQAAALIEGIVAGEQPLTILCVEGSIINGPGGSGGFDMSKADRSATLLLSSATGPTMFSPWAAVLPTAASPLRRPTPPSPPACSTRTASRVGC
jgi:Ni,Fe-hydrogenase I small subunit